MVDEATNGDVKPNGSARDSEDVIRALAAMTQLRAAEESVLLARSAFARQIGLTFNGARDLWATLGYPDFITNSLYRDRYRRGGVAARIVEALPNAAWRGDMRLTEDEDPHDDTPFEQAWVVLNKKHKIKEKLRRANISGRLSTYSVVLIGAPGELDTELPRAAAAKGAAGPANLLYVKPYPGGGGLRRDGRTSETIADVADVVIREYDTDPKSERFGLPLTYQLRNPLMADPSFLRPVHWTRIIHIAEGLLFDDVFGTPALERVWNLLEDLDKVTGGGAEAFWNRADQGLHADVDKDMALDKSKDTLDVLKTQVDEWRHNRARMFRTRGVSIDMLGSDVANFSPPADAILTQIAGACGIPKRILTGSEMGELASSQDRDNWKDQINGYQTQFLGPMVVRALVDRLIEYGYLPEPAKGADAYDVAWPHIETLTEDEKAAGAQKWAATNQAAGATVFTEDEIRDKWYGMEPGADDNTEPWRADLALKMATANKTQGAIVFTDDEIRKTCYGWEPLKPEEKIPLTAPERVSATAPTPTVDAEGNPLPAKTPKTPALVAAEDIELLRVLEAAIIAGNEDVIKKIVGLDV